MIHPAPPFQEGAQIGGGQQCYYPGCDTICKSWGGMLTHVRTKHKRSHSSLNGTWLHTAGSAHIDEVQNARNKKHRAAKKARDDAAEANAAEAAPLEDAPAPPPRATATREEPTDDPPAPPSRAEATPPAVPGKSDGPMDLLTVPGGPSVPRKRSHRFYVF